jgi:hypothetical protein
MVIGRVLQQEIQEAVEALRAGELVAFPTRRIDRPGIVIPDA